MSVSLLDHKTDDDICVVAYALNPKKMRRGHAPSSSPSRGGVLGVGSSSSSNETSAMDDGGAGKSVGELTSINKEEVVPRAEVHAVAAGGAAATGSGASPWAGGGLADLLEGQQCANVRFVAFDYEACRNGEDKIYDVIIHKLTEDVESKDSDSANKISTISDYLYRHPSASIIDPFEAVRVVVSRARTCRKLRELEEAFEKRHGGRKRCPFRQPRFAVSESPELLCEAVARAGLSFPVMCKPIEACGTPLSHSMVVAVDPEGLSLVECPSVAQEYINHSGLFFKVYVIDQDVMVFQRPSLPDLVPDMTRDAAASTSVRSVAFDSRFAYPTVEDFYYSSSGMQLCSDGEQSASSETSGSAAALDTRRRQDRRRKPRNEDLASHQKDHHHHHHHHHHSTSGSKHSKKQAKDSGGGSLESRLHAQFVAIAKIISEGCGLSLYGFDVIVPSSSHSGISNSGTDHSVAGGDDSSLMDLVVVDINFFPSYKEVKDFPDKLCEYLLRKKRSHKK